MNLDRLKIKEILDVAFDKYNSPEFIAHDPISLPHLFTKKQDIEIIGFFAALFAWGQRTTIINKGRELISLFDNDPHNFILHHVPSERKKLLNFVHRTFSGEDLQFLVEKLQQYYAMYQSLEELFVQDNYPLSVESGLHQLHLYFFPETGEYLRRTKKHIPSPIHLSACKRINMFLRWMVREDSKGVDFGIWKQIKPSSLYCPLDLHVERTARRLGLLTHPTVNWKAVKELTNNLRAFDPIDPIKYDFALFGLSLETKTIRKPSIRAK